MPVGLTLQLNTVRSKVWGCQNYGPDLGCLKLDGSCYNDRDKKESIIFTTSHTTWRVWHSVGVPHTAKWLGQRARISTNGVAQKKHVGSISVRLRDSVGVTLTRETPKVLPENRLRELWWLSATKKYRETRNPRYCSKLLSVKSVKHGLELGFRALL